MDIKKVLDIIAVNDIETDSVLTNLAHAYLQERDKNLEQYRKLEAFMTSTQQQSANFNAKLVEMRSQITALQNDLEKEKSAHERTRWSLENEIDNLNRDSMFDSPVPKDERD